MSNFQFLEPEFTSLAATAKEAEKLVYISHNLPLLQHEHRWKTLFFGYINTIKNSLSLMTHRYYNLLNDLKFKELIPPYIWDKMDNIRMVGNSAVHGKKFKQLTTEETVKHISHLFLMYVWFERNYGSPSKDRSQIDFI